MYAIKQKLHKLYGFVLNNISDLNILNINIRIIKYLWNDIILIFIFYLFI